MLATRQIAARPAFAVLQVSALAVGLLALVLLVLLRTDLIAAWRRATPPDAPNRFVINLQPEQGEAFRRRLLRARRRALRLVPDDPRPAGGDQRPRVSADSFADERARRLVDREFNLSHAAELPGAQRDRRPGAGWPTRPMALSASRKAWRRRSA